MRGIRTIIGVICEPNEARAALEMLHCTCAERVLSKWNKFVHPLTHSLAHRAESCIIKSAACWIIVMFIEMSPRFQSGRCSLGPKCAARSPLLTQFVYIYNIWSWEWAAALLNHVLIYNKVFSHHASFIVLTHAISELSLIFCTLLHYRAPLER